MFSWNRPMFSSDHALLRAGMIALALALAPLPGVSSSARAQEAMVSQQAAEKAARTMVAALNADDLAATGALLDLEGIADTLAESIFDRASERAGFKRSFLGTQAREQLLTNLFSRVIGENAHVTFLKVLREDGQPRPLIRVEYLDAGVEYIVLHLVAGDAGEARVADMYTATTGSTTVESMRAATQLLFVQQRSTLARLLGLKRVDHALVEKFRRLAELRRSGDFAAAYDVYRSLPDEARSTRTIVLLGVQLAQGVDDEAYLHELSQLVSKFPDDESLEFIKIDYYIMTAQPRLALPAIDGLIERFGADGALLDTKASIAILDGRPMDAVSIARRALQVEPNYEEPLWTLATVFAQQQDFDKLVVVLESLERDFDYEFTPASFEDDFYAEFAASDIYSRWMARRASER